MADKYLRLSSKLNCRENLLWLGAELWHKSIGRFNRIRWLWVHERLLRCLTLSKVIFDRLDHVLLIWLFLSTMVEHLLGFLMLKERPCSLYILGFLRNFRLDVGIPKSFVWLSIFIVFLIMLIGKRSLNGRCLILRNYLLMRWNLIWILNADL